MRALLAVSLLALAAPAAAPASRPLVVAEVTVTRPTGPPFPARIAYPRGGSGLPVVAFGHGYLAPVSLYAGTLDALARRGYVVVAPESSRGLFPSHAAFAGELDAALRWVVRESAHGGALPRGTADGTRLGVSGHSMGGGAAVLAAARDPGIGAVGTLAAAETRPSATEAAGRLRVPSLFVVGSADRIVPPASTRAIYEAAPTPALLATVAGGSHCGFLDTAILAGVVCDRGTIAVARQVATARELLGRFFDRTLRGAAVPVTGAPGVAYDAH